MAALKYSGPFAFLLAIPLVFSVSEAAALAVPVVLLLTLVATHCCEGPADEAAEHSPWSQPLPMLYIVCQLALLLWAAQAAARTGFGASAFCGLALSLGVCAGVFGVLSAHEMVHSRSRSHRILGAIMLTAISYRHFRIAHLHGHHRLAATRADASTARLGESFYGFLRRALPQQLRDSWRFEQRRVRNGSFPLWGNRVAQDIVLMAAIYAALFLTLSWKASALMAAESAVAIVVLELFNYVAHYGLVRRPGEPMRAAHSWNSSGAENYLIFNMGRHSHHHRGPSIGYERLQGISAPELPGGYAGAIVLALVPPVWRRIMDRRLVGIGASGLRLGYDAESSSTAFTP